MDLEDVKHRILIPCDFSPLSLHALRFAAGLCRDRHCELVVLTVFDSGKAPAIPDGEIAVSRRLEDAIRELAITTPVRHIIRPGRFVNTVLEVIGAEEIGMVLLGTRGSRGWDGLFMGSHAEKIVRTSPVPVMSIREQAHAGGIRNVVVPVDLREEPAAMAACMMPLFGAIQARWHLLHVITGRSAGDDEVAASLREFGRKLGLDHFHVAVERASDEAEGILRYAGMMGADMIAICTHGERNPGQMFGHSVAADVVNHSRVSVWTSTIRALPVAHTH
nr:universal stress protein [uncultured Dyadobacter sp.]